MTELTTTERAAHAMEMAEHRREKCRSCSARIDLVFGGYVCGKGEDTEVVMMDPRNCRAWVFEEDQEGWL